MAANNHVLLRIADSISQLNTYIGKALSWLVIIMSVTVLYIVINRAITDSGSIALQESVTYMHAIVFMLCLGYTLNDDEHVRVDILYRKFTPVQRAWVDAIGAIVLLLPFSIFMTVISWQFVVNAWHIHEGSANPGGIEGIYLLKTLIPVAGFLLSLQALSECFRKLVHITYHPSAEA